MYHNIAKIPWFNQFLSRIHLVRQQEKGFSVKQCPAFLISRWCILLSDFSLLENSISSMYHNIAKIVWFNQYFIEDSSCQVARKGVFCEIVPRISGFKVAHTICQTSHFWKIVFSSMYHNIAKIALFNQFLSKIHLVRQQEKGFSVKQCPGFLVSRQCILL